MARGSNANIRKYRKNVKRKVINAYGGKCSCCGETELLFLAIDHKYGHRNKDKKYKAGYHFLKTLLNKPNRHDLQVLCHNCNQGRHLNEGVCPHGSHSNRINLRSRINANWCETNWNGNSRRNRMA